jgi:hypothetical protein
MASTIVSFRSPICTFCSNTAARKQRAFFYPGGHMGGGDAQAVIVQWLKEKLS